jgi:glutathione S-transferase
VAGELDLMPEDDFQRAISLKILMDCNDVLMEICRYNGSFMWERDDWIGFRSRRFPRWLAIFEESLERGFFGQESVTFADIGVYALLGNLMRCLPQLDADVVAHAPGTHALCQRIGSIPSLARYVAEQETLYGETYCGSQIEQSIRRMLEMDHRSR